ncbi:phosphoglyceromutase [Corynebacterium liangguodongii]|uniref:2,3-bisphosphoglycerate-dependent phosphoglycerate mutase n=1 Tax=Corynebacterium liangguodongii TaxID=2079535 RepID=A0A2S0WBY8_9CORY|nr:phosphoglyceromutase [Corynebacterium liangguodongii]AWB83278.1 phosphoglyceromutase [Corynebacterium liangguodongii]PWC00632.1 phosphoglyceromutase [Corynebacterium liangguodongii]
MSIGKLILVRHGQSTWNESNQFTGWVDVDLTAQGEQEAKNAGKLLADNDVLPDIVFTSLLRRAIRTANIALNAADRHWIPVERNWRLNERHYGRLQGLNKAEIREEYGEEQFMTWRRSYDTPPPELADDNEYSQAFDPRYAFLPAVPRTECLKDVVARLLPFYEDVILPEALEGKNVMVAAHGNSLRALVKHLDAISDDDIAGLNIPTGMPLVYELGERGVVLNPGGTYLDPAAAAAGAAAVANQGNQK